MQTLIKVNTSSSWCWAWPSSAPAWLSFCHISAKFCSYSLILDIFQQPKKYQRFLRFRKKLLSYAKKTLVGFFWFTIYVYVWLCMTLYDYVWPYTNKSDYVWLYMPMHDYVWLCMNIYDYVCLYMTIYDNVWPCMTMYD